MTQVKDGNVNMSVNTAVKIYIKKKKEKYCDFNWIPLQRVVVICD